MPILRKIFTFLVDAVETFLVAGSVFLVCYIFIFRPFQVSGLSMYPTFDDQEGILTSIISKNISPIKRGDVIVFHAPPPNDTEKDFIKRVIGLAGETVMVKNGDVYLNDQKLDESKYLKSEVRTYGGPFLKEGVGVTVPPDNYIVMGDNRSYSSDSREWGFVSKDKIIGESWVVYWPMSKFGLIKNPYSN